VLLLRKLARRRFSSGGAALQAAMCASHVALAQSAGGGDSVGGTVMKRARKRMLTPCRNPWPTASSTTLRSSSPAMSLQQPTDAMLCCRARAVKLVLMRAVHAPA
jgi:hypothetical protein